MNKWIIVLTYIILTFPCNARSITINDEESSDTNKIQTDSHISFTNTKAAKVEQALLILNSDKLSDTKMTIADIEAAGGKIGHVITPRTIIANVPVEKESGVLAIPNIKELYRGIVLSSEAIKHPGATVGISAWNSMVDQRVATNSVSLDQPTPLIGDSLEPSFLSLESFDIPESSTMPGYSQTSEFMIGEVVVGVILPESDGGTENWSSSRQNSVFNEIVAGLNWWILKAPADANLTFYYDLQFSVPTQYEPINMAGQSDQNIWVTDIFENMGYTGSRFEQAYDYINDLRNTFETDWCYTFIVVDSLNDPDGKFNDGYFAWAYVGGPYSIMTYDNNGWEISRMDSVAKHESGHIFLAGDEYCSPGYACCNFGYYGYLGVYNGNCELDNPSSVPCIMREGQGDAICDYTIGQIGWRDSDGDAY